MSRYNPKEIETKWQDAWEESGIYRATEDPSKPKKYILEYFPYPSGAAMHVGHVRNYTIGDVLARFNRMAGYNVLHPMGWDAFGLPAENYAIKNQISPRVAIDQNTARFKEQLMQMGFSYDWTREIDSTDPEYYKWTQWFFLLLFKLGLAYQQESLQWWCPFDKTVLANEQVENGKCWRCGNDVEKKALKQWFFKITDYADRLADDLDNVDWSDAIKAMQRNWIGRSTGAEIEFKLAHENNYVLLHGFKGSPSADFFPWAKSILGADGHAVAVPDLPNADKPDAKEQAAFVLQQVDFDENTVLLGHSYGSVTALRIVEQLKKPIKRLVLAASFAQPGFKDEERVFEATTDWNFDFDAIKKNAHEIIILRDTTDPIVPAERAEYLREKLSGRIVDFAATGGHITGKQEPGVLAALEDVIQVFTTRPDTLYGATFMVLSPEHPLVERITTAEHKQKVNIYRKAAQQKSDIERQETNREKTGVFTGAYAVNPLSGEKIPVWIADYVLMGYGTGAIMAVPAHDERDFEFATKFGLPIVRVVQNDAPDNEHTHDEGVMIHSGPYDGMPSDEAREKIVKSLAEKGFGHERVNYRMRDWLISRQRYWGAPIPIIHCAACGAVAVPEDQLPVQLPELEKFEPSGDGRSPLANVKEWVNTTCPECGGPAERETDTMDGFACSSWYFLRFADPHNNKRPFDKSKADFWLPVDDYIGGAEHAVMHLLYARMWTKVMYDQGMIEFNEPFTKLRNQGMILAPDGQKMSKSKGNTIEPGILIDQGYGADSIRIMEMFIGPWNQAANWSVEGMGGAFRFLQRIWTLVQEYNAAKENGAPEQSDELTRLQHRVVKKVSEDIESMSFNTAIAALMELTNELYRIKAADNYRAANWQEMLETVLLLLAPFAPHMTEELWHQLGHESSVHTASWPAYDDAYLIEDTLTIVIQVNGKLRSEVTVASDAAEEQIVEAAKADSKVAAHISGQEIRKTIYVPGRLVNFVVA